MSKYMVQARFSPQGAKGVLARGGTDRRAAVEKSVEMLGGRLESYHFTFGAQDAVLLVELPDNATAAALAMTVEATGAATITTTPLLTCEEIDQAAAISVEYRPPST